MKKLRKCGKVSYGLIGLSPFNHNNAKYNKLPAYPMGCIFFKNSVYDYLNVVPRGSLDHYDDVTMNAMASQITSLTIVLLKRLF